MYVCICMHVCMCVCIYVCVYVCMYVCMYVCVCIHVYVCMHYISGGIVRREKCPTQNGRGNCPGVLSGEIVRGIVLHSVTATTATTVVIMTIIMMKRMMDILNSNCKLMTLMLTADINYENDDDDHHNMHANTA